VSRAEMGRKISREDLRAHMTCVVPTSYASGLENRMRDARKERVSSHVACMPMAWSRRAEAVTTTLRCFRNYSAFHTLAAVAVSTGGRPVGRRALCRVFGRKDLADLARRY
jgi:hypothetical protein